MTQKKVNTFGCIVSNMMEKQTTNIRASIKTLLHCATMERASSRPIFSRTATS